MAQFKVSVSTKFVGSEVEDVIEIEDEVLEDLNEEERNELIEEEFKQWVWENINSYYEEL